MNTETAANLLELGLEKPKVSHTPGPWEINQRVDNPCGIDAFISIANVHGVAYAFGDTKEQREANAHLIAAAPDLLEACKAVLRWAQVMNLYGTSSEPACVDMCEAAIAKAEGSDQ